MSNQCKGYHWAKIISPSEFEPESGSTKDIAEGILVATGKLKGRDHIVAQSYRFDSYKFTAAEAKAWMKKSGITYADFTEYDESAEVKSGARNSASDLATLNKLHAMTHEMRHHLESLGASGQYPVYRETKADEDPWLDEWKNLKGHQDGSN